MYVRIFFFEFYPSVHPSISKDWKGENGEESDGKREAILASHSYAGRHVWKLQPPFLDDFLKIVITSTEHIILFAKSLESK